MTAGYNPAAKFDVKIWDIEFRKTASRTLMARVYQPQGGVARCRDTVVLAGAHELNHLVGRVADLDVDLAPGLLLEGMNPVDLRIVLPALRISRPGDDVQCPLAGAD